MNNLIDFFRLFNQEELRSLLINVINDPQKRNSVQTLSHNRIVDIFFAELQSAANLSAKERDRNTILRKGLERLMKKFDVPFTSNLDDEALFRLFRRFISDKILEYATPMLKCGYFMARCDNNFNSDEKELLEYFVRHLDILEEVKREYLVSFFRNAEQEYKAVEKKDPVAFIAKVYRSQKESDKLQILKFCYIIALVDGKLVEDEVVFHEKLARKWKIDARDTLRIRKEATDIYEEIRKSESFKQVMGCNGYNELIVYASLSKIGTDLMKDFVVLCLRSPIEFATYKIYHKFITNIDYNKLNILLTSLVFRVHEEIKEEKVEHACTILQKMVIETEEMILLCKDIHFYLNNMNKSYSDVAEQAWLKGVLGQLSNSNRKKLVSGGTLLKEVVDDVNKLLLKIMKHQQTLKNAIDQHLGLILISEKLQNLVKKLMCQNNEYSKILAEAEKAEIMIAA